jgi:hypothetical protein
MVSGGQERPRDQSGTSDFGSCRQHAPFWERSAGDTGTRLCANRMGSPSSTPIRTKCSVRKSLYAPAVAATVEFYEQVLSAFPDRESLTVLVAAGTTRDAVLAGVGADLSNPAEDAWDFHTRSAAWAAIEVPGGVLAVELSGYGDPSLADLASLSKAGAAALVRCNIQAHHRFGAARAGELIFDDDEYIYLRDPDRIPAELRPLFDAAWVDLDSDDDDERADPLATGLAMAEMVTGIELPEGQVAAIFDAEFFLAPSPRYPDAQATDVSPAAPPQVKLGPGVRRFNTDHDFFYAEGGSYPVMSGWDYSFHGTGSHDDAPAGFGLAVVTRTAVDEWAGDGVQTAWIGLLDRSGEDQRVSLTVLHAKTEPTSTLESLRAAYTDEASGVIRGRHRDNLMAIGRSRHLTNVTDRKHAVDADGMLALHVFARRVTWPEEHVLVLWPTTGG